MKYLSEILQGVEVISRSDDRERAVGSVVFDSRKVTEGDIFVAVKGTLADGHHFIDTAVQKGAGVIVCEDLPEDTSGEVLFIRVKDSHNALSMMASSFFNHPSSQLDLVGITGTNGKTTTAFLLHGLFTAQGIKAGLISTVINKIGNKEIPSTHTTPDPVQLNGFLRQMADEGCRCCFMEVSSHALHQKRTSGLIFTGGIFTNLTHDHLDYHKTFDEYLKVKKSFFDTLPASAFALINADDRNGKVMVQNTRAAVKSYSLTGRGDFNCKIIENQLAGLHLKIGGVEIWFRLIGRYNAYNLLAAYAAATLMGMENQRILAGLSILRGAEGRFDYVKSAGNVLGIIDYAHTPDALDNILTTISDFRSGNETLITVFGAGGDRDRTKRPVMGRIASIKSDKVIITSDNPRSEYPENIINEIIKGIDPELKHKVIAVPDREQAIKTACLLAAPRDIILVAGKGHEKYQEIKGVKYPFDDREMLEKFLLVNTNRT
ncbi:MAG: UDP-N-acetylmuramoyl-L-alanyl-D-glutamate--2,6-diaminopimelate ligase [Bacteroidales bacterium]|nr:UDP-N-acetylmuramoyl-L-alanyl-D-glutamate--2,6-diaminopimelate ligase [Bacteroidales bacterium]